MVMAQFTMRFAFYHQERSRGIFWSGPYQVVAKDVNEAKDILTDAVLKEAKREDSPLHMIRLLECENRMNPGRNEEHYCSVSIAIADEIRSRRLFKEQWELEQRMKRKYPKGVPRFRNVDDEWDWGDGEI